LALKRSPVSGAKENLQLEILAVLTALLTAEKSEACSADVPAMLIFSIRSFQKRTE
jgi:hypothetical protein